MNTKSNYVIDARSTWRVLFALVFALSMAGAFVYGVQASTYVVTNLNNSGGGSLRQAVLDANTHAGADMITFNVSGKITLLSSLHISDDLTIDGSGRNITVSGGNTNRVFYNEGVMVFLVSLKINQGYQGGVGGLGGAVYNDGGTLTVQDCTFTNNSSSYFGGAIYSSNGTLVVIDSTFSSNHVPYNGGAIYVASGTASINSSTFSTNKGNVGRGGGIHNNGGALMVTNSTFSGNSNANGGGIYGYGGTLTITNSTFSGNGATNHGGSVYFDVAASGVLDLKNSILANSTSGEDCYSNVLPSADISNIIEINMGCGTPASSADPQLEPLANHGGPTQTFALPPTSPAIGAADDATCTAWPVSKVDQRGVVRPLDSHCDIGSYEAPVFRSVSILDGWILESSETSGLGGTLNSSATTIRLGDETGDRQYQAILSFNTRDLPYNAVIENAVLRIKGAGLVGANPFMILGGLVVDIRKPYFGTSPALVVSDFQAAVSISEVGTFGVVPVNNWYSAVIGSAGFRYINKAGTTQFRLRFAKDDNNDNAADYMKFYSGNYVSTASRPVLVIEYYIP